MRGALLYVFDGKLRKADIPEMEDKQEAISLTERSVPEDSIIIGVIREESDHQMSAVCFPDSPHREIFNSLQSEIQKLVDEMNADS